MKFGNKEIIKIYKGVKEVTSIYLNNIQIFINSNNTTLIQVTGTLQTDGNESLVVVGGGTYISTILDTEGATPTWDATLGDDNTITTDYLDGLGLPVLVRAALNHTHVVRTSDTVITVTFPSVSDYEISEDETWTQIAPANSNSFGAITASNSIIIAYINIGAYPNIADIVNDLSFLINVINPLTTTSNEVEYNFSQSEFLLALENEY